MYWELECLKQKNENEVTGEQGSLEVRTHI